jgi:hypothetical protein
MVGWNGGTGYVGISQWETSATAGSLQAAGNGNQRTNSKPVQSKEKINGPKDGRDNRIRNSRVGWGTIRGAARAGRATHANTPYPSMAPLDQYLMEDRTAEIALARSAAPPSISKDATVMVLGRQRETAKYRKQACEP